MVYKLGLEQKTQVDTQAQVLGAVSCVHSRSCTICILELEMYTKGSLSLQACFDV
jgi:hypothetical protein